MDSSALYSNHSSLTPMMKSLMADSALRYSSNLDDYLDSNKSHVQPMVMPMPADNNALLAIARAQLNQRPNSVQQSSEFANSHSLLSGIDQTKLQKKGGHKHIHPKKYFCNHDGCGKTFTTSGHLARHRRIHTGDRQFVCPWHGCEKRFSRQDNMRQHLKTHTKDKSGSKRSKGFSSIAQRSSQLGLFGPSAGLALMHAFSAPNSPLCKPLSRQTHGPDAQQLKLSGFQSQTPLSTSLSLNNTPLISSAHSTPLVRNMNPYQARQLVQSQLYSAANEMRAEMGEKEKDDILEQLCALSSGVSPYFVEESGSFMTNCTNSTSASSNCSVNGEEDLISSEEADEAFASLFSASKTFPSTSTHDVNDYASSPCSSESLLSSSNDEESSSSPELLFLEEKPTREKTECPRIDSFALLLDDLPFPKEDSFDILAI